MYGAQVERCKELNSGKECQWQAMMGLIEDSRSSRKSGARRKSADRKSPTPDEDSHHSRKSGARRKSADRKSPGEDPAKVDQDEDEVVLDDIDEADRRRLTVNKELYRLKAIKARREQKRVVEEVPATAEYDAEEPPAIVHEILGVQFSSKDDKSCQALFRGRRRFRGATSVPRRMTTRESGLSKQRFPRWWTWRSTSARGRGARWPCR